MGSILIRDGAILTSDGWKESGYVQIQNEQIVSVSAGSPPAELVSSSEEIISAQHCAVLPGLINAHTHLSQAFMRGLAGGRPLVDWLKDVIWPIQNVVSPEELHLVAVLGLLENLRCGATEIVNHHKVIKTPQHTDAVLDAAQQVGLRFTLARAWSDMGEISETPESIILDLERLFEKWGGNEHLSIANGPIALWRCSAETLRAAHQLAIRNGSFTHFHVSESQREVEMSMDMYAKRPVAWLDSIGVLDTDTQIVHAVWVDDTEIEMIATAGAQVIHCPVSNAILGSGISPIAEFLHRGIPVRLGTDGPASNDTQDLWETLKTALGFSRASTLDPTTLPPAQALRLATGGRCLEPGAPADLIIVDMNHPRAVPVHDFDSALVLSTHGSDVKTTIIGGEILMRDGQVLILDEPALLDECRLAAKHLLKRARLS